MRMRASWAGRSLVAACLFALLPSPPGQAATRYDGDGELVPRLECERWYINRARYAPEAEADRLGLTNTTAGGSPGYDCCEDTNGPNDFGSTTDLWAWWQASLPPLAPNLMLSTAASNHSRDMAETGLFQHNSPSANYYPYLCVPTNRWMIGGYASLVTGYIENISYDGAGSTGGYPASGGPPSDTHNSLYVDHAVTATNRGHRKAILNRAALEIGLGWTRTNEYDAPYYWTYEYDTQDFSRRSTNFFTDTAFYDANSNRVYDEGEGVGGIQVRLWNGAVEADWYDESKTSGCFAIPIVDLPDGDRIEVRLVNTNNAIRRLTIPFGYDTVGEIQLTNYGTGTLGWYTQPYGLTNAGFRNVDLRAAGTAVGPTGATVRLTWSAPDRLPCTAQSCDDISSGTWTSFQTATGVGGTVTFLDTGQGGRSAPDSVTGRFYRIQMVRD